MAKKLFFPTLALAGGALCAGVRFWNLNVGFDLETGLPLGGDVSHLVLVAVLLLAAVACWWSGRKANGSSVFSPGQRPHTLALMCYMGGALLLVASGVLHGKAAFGVSQLELLAGALVAVGGIGLASEVQAFAGKKAPDCTMLLCVVFSAVMLLIMEYRTMSINPVVGAYYVEILALCAVLMAFFQLAGYGVALGKDGKFRPWAGLAVVLCCAVIVEGHPLYVTLFFAGSALTLLGGLLVEQVD